MATTRPVQAPSSPEKAPRQVKSKHKSRSGCQACKLRRLKCDETKPSCRNCQKKGQECPGYTLRLQWSTKYERPRQPSRAEPTNFDELVSAVTQSIVPGGQTPAPVLEPAWSVKSASSSSSSESPAPAGTSSCISIPPPPVQIKPSRSPRVISRSITSAPAIPSPFPASNTSILSNRSVARLGHIVPPAPQVSRPLVDIPSFLIQHWFKSVCGSWSAFDSQTNPYRQLSASLWHSSEAVFYALQSMAAASLVEHLPHLKEVSRSAPRLAAQAITFELQSFRATSKGPVNFPRELVLSLFCMSSSICWTDSRQFGLQYLKPGRAVLNCLNKVAQYLTPADRELLNFFNGCLIYEEMLRSIVSNDDTDMENLAKWHVSSAQPISVVPHAWTGVSPDLLQLFGKTMFLCRRSRNRWRQPDNVTDKMLNETADYQEAAIIEEVLLATELPELPLVEDATEEAALKRHIHDAAEAYRLSSLLQLYQTFPSLIARRLPGQVDGNGLVPYSGWLSPLALHITNILRSIPPSSSMRCLQPLICLCAGTGLRYDNIHPLMRTPNNPFMTSAAQPSSGLGFDTLGTATSTAYGLSGPSGLSSSVLGENDLEIASARRFLMERLSRLEQNLPPKPIQVEKELLKSIWATYDAETDGTCTTHWLDVMVNNELESVFG
ncbi:fungal-specific transcription factor domain-containing protein [Coniochaeta sp. 2T2.1]|nr:fungal-specific transcription factor domain-containing protein [Coniochaeta sp. 2T2.1]